LRYYLRRVYKKCIKDFRELNFRPSFRNRDFKCLLCGVGNEVTADEFISFVLKKNLKAEIVIIDIGNKQIKAVKRLVKDKYSDKKIKVVKYDALNLLDLLNKNSINWIETDGFLEYFDKFNLERLLKIWKKLLKPNGFITTRAMVSNNGFERLVDLLRVKIGRMWLGVKLYPHDKKEMNSLLKKLGYRFIIKSTLLPTFKRISLF